jgi:predicted transposase YdaD
MATDKLFLEYATHFTSAFAGLIGVEAGAYEVKSITLKATENRTDIFLVSQSGANVVLVETQGYDDEYLYHRMVAAKMLFCVQHKYTGDMDAAVIFLEESNYGKGQIRDERKFKSISSAKAPNSSNCSRQLKPRLVVTCASCSKDKPAPAKSW